MRPKLIQYPLSRMKADMSLYAILRLLRSLKIEAARQTWYTMDTIRSGIFSERYFKK